jgi:hypothetical protein
LLQYIIGFLIHKIFNNKKHLSNHIQCLEKWEWFCQVAKYAFGNPKLTFSTSIIDISYISPLFQSQTTKGSNSNCCVVTQSPLGASLSFRARTGREDVSRACQYCLVVLPPNGECFRILNLTIISLLLLIGLI